MSELMDGFFDQTLEEYVFIGWKAVELLTESMAGDNAAWSSHLRLTENKSENGNVEIQHGHAERTPSARVYERLHGSQDFRGMILLAFPMQSERWIERLGYHGARDLEQSAEILRQTAEKPAVDVADRDQFKALHRVSTVGRLQPYFLIL